MEYKLKYLDEADAKGAQNIITQVLSSFIEQWEALKKAMPEAAQLEMASWNLTARTAATSAAEVLFILRRGRMVHEGTPLDEHEEAWLVEDLSVISDVALREYCKDMPQVPVKEVDKVIREGKMFRSSLYYPGRN